MKTDKVLRIQDLKPAPGSRKRRKRLGRGESSGHGKTSTKGNKGQNARSGGGVRLGFEGGQIPLIRRIPIRGFRHTRLRPAIVNLYALEKFPDGAKVDLEGLKKMGLVPRSSRHVKILGEGALTKKLTVAADFVSEAAKEKITGAGGSFEKPRAAA